MIHKSCKFQIKNGKFIPSPKPVETLLMYKQQYNLINNNSELIVETHILVKPLNKEPETIKHQTLIFLSGFDHEPFEIKDAIRSLMFELRHNIFDKIKLELGINNDKFLLIYFPNEEQFSCLQNEDLKFDNYNFSPALNLNLLTKILY